MRRTKNALVGVTLSDFPSFWESLIGGDWVGPDGLEPSTSSLSGKRSNQAELWARIARLAKGKATASR